MIRNVERAFRAHHVLRAIFVSGLSLSIVLYFFPFYSPSGELLNAWLRSGGAERSLSSFDLCRLLLGLNQTSVGFFYMGLTAFEIVLLFLAIRRPRRWVFIVASSEQLSLFIKFLLEPPSPDLSSPLIASVLTYASFLMCLSGYFVKTPLASEVLILATRPNRATAES